MYMAPRDRTDHAVHHQLVRLLEVLHDLLRLRSEDPVDAVRSQDLHTSENTLKPFYVIPGVAQLNGRRYSDAPVVLLSRPLEFLFDQLLPGQRADHSICCEMDRHLEC